MKKFDNLLKQLQNKEYEELEKSLNQLYNVVRDFSQSIIVDTEIKANYGNIEQVKQLKERVREWVGGR